MTKAPSAQSLLDRVEELEVEGAVGATEVHLANALYNVLYLVEASEGAQVRALTTASVRAAIAEAVLA